MCGICGYVGDGDVIMNIIKGLKQLEYRGYDSAGIAWGDSMKIELAKTVGKVEELRKSMNDQLEKKGFWGGIGHTRWATHGCPTIENAHPHFDCGKRFYVVHNGIIENYVILKKYLQEKGHSFVSETDTEVFAHLLEEYSSEEPIEMIRKTVSHLKGSFSFLMMDKKNPGNIYGLKKGSPLLVGLGEREYYLSSSLNGFSQDIKRCIYLDEEEIVVIYKEGYYVYDFYLKKLDKTVEQTNLQLDLLDKGDFEHYMRKEIFEQPRTVKDAFRGRIDKSNAVTKLDGIEINQEELRHSDRLIISACGTSWHAGLIGEYFFENLAKIPTEVEYASEFRYKDPVIRENDVCFFISQSGETADTIAALEEALRKKALCVGVCNTVNSTLSRKTHSGVYLHAGSEIGVASTKAFTSQVTVLLLIAIYLGRMKNLSYEDGYQILEELEKIPEKIQEIYRQEQKMKDISNILKKHDNALFLGRGLNFPVALEGALKLKEISYIHAEGYPAAEMKHGPIALIDENMPVFVVATKDPLYDKMISNVKEIKARKGKIFSVISKEDNTMKELSDDYIEVPMTIPVLSPLLNIIPFQLLAYHTALAKGCNVDQPRNLAKSVTVE